MARTSTDEPLVGMTTFDIFVRSTDARFVNQDIAWQGAISDLKAYLVEQFAAISVRQDDLMKRLETNESDIKRILSNGYSRWAAQAGPAAALVKVEAPAPPPPAATPVVNWQLPQVWIGVACGGLSTVYVVIKLVKWLLTVVTIVPK